MRELIAYTDGGSRGNPGPAAAAVYFPDGLVDAAFDEYTNVGRLHTEGKYIGTRTNNEAEYEALILALQRALNHGYDKLTVFTDSEVMMKQMRGVYRCGAPTLIPLFEKAYGLACQLDFEINHVPREQNKEADTIVNEVLNAHHNGSECPKCRDKQ